MANEKNDARIVLAEPVAFDGTNESKIVTTTVLSKYINELFKGAFKDYVGCTIRPVQQNESVAGEIIALDLYFAANSDNGKGNVAAFCAAGADTKASASSTPDAKHNIIGACLGHNQMITTTSSMVVTAEGVSMLYPFILNGYKNRLKETSESFSKCGIAVETSIASQYGMNRPVVYNIIKGVDINAVMKVIFGDKDNTFEFQVAPVKPVYSSVYGSVDNMSVGSKWIYSIMKLDKSNLNDLMNELGFYNKVSNLGVLTDSF